MSDQSQFYNPQLDRMALSGVGFIIPRLTTTQRLSVSLSTNDVGIQVYDTTVGGIFFWDGTTWAQVEVV